MPAIGQIAARTENTTPVPVEEGHDFATSANFGGGGRSYLFNCHPCRQAAFLWQR